MVDIIGGVGTVTNLLIGGVLNSDIEVLNDSDWVRVNLVAGRTYRIEVDGSAAIPSNTDTLLTLRNSAGVQLAVNDDAGGANASLYSLLTFTATTTGVYYLDVQSGANGTGTGNYALTINDTAVAYTNDRIATQLISGFSAFNNETPRHWNVAPGGTLTYNLTGLAADGQALARAAFAVWRDATGIIFNEVAGAAQITLDDNQPDAFENDVFANGIITSATVNVSTQWLIDQGNTINSYGFQTYVHEIGHALGLGHGGNYNGNATYGTDNQYLNDCWQTTVMSYFDQQQNTFINVSRAFVMTPMVADILAMQTLYGVSTSTRVGNTVYGFNSTAGNDIFDASVYNDVAYTIVDNGGNDTLDYSGFAQSQRIDLNAEKYSNIGGLKGNVTIARNSIIENAIGGSGNDILLGNAATNRLEGGLGNDYFFVDNALDTVIEAVGGGVDRVYASATYTLGAGQEIETLSTTNNAGGGAISLTGNAFNNTIIGNAGANVLSGGGGVDTMTGLNGNDSYAVDSATDVVNEAVGGGIDRVYASATYTLGAGQEIETLSTNNNAGATLINLTGNAFNNSIIGNAAGNTLNGGLGNDTLTGLNGADFFLFNTALNAATNHDTITDFNVPADTIQLENAVFTLLTIAGTLASASFKDLSLAAQDANDIIVYNRATGDLFYDTNGLTAGGQTLFADVANGTALTFADFVVV